MLAGRLADGPVRHRRQSTVTRPRHGPPWPSHTELLARCRTSRKGDYVGDCSLRWGGLDRILPTPNASRQLKTKLKVVKVLARNSVPNHGVERIGLYVMG